MSARKILAGSLVACWSLLGTARSHMEWVVDAIYKLDDAEDILERIGEKLPPAAELSFTPTGDDLESGVFATHGSK